MSWSPNPFSTSPSVPSPSNNNHNSQLYSYRLLRSVQTNWTSGQLTHCPYYRPFSAFDSGTVVPPFLVGGGHLFEWRSSLHHQPLVTVLFSVHPGFDFPSPRILITNSTSHACPSIVVLWWDIPAEPPFTVLEYLYKLNPLLDEDLTPLAIVLSAFCLEYYKPLSPFSNISPILHIPPTLPPTPYLATNPLVHPE